MCNLLNFLPMKKPFVLWLTGRPAAGKTTIAGAVCQELKNGENDIHHLDGDEVRAAAKEKLGYSKEDRDKNISLAVEIAKKYQDQGVNVIASFITPYQKHRRCGKEKLENYIEVYIDSSLEICEARDPKGMYKKARAGEIEFFTGITDRYEKPENPDIHLKTGRMPVDECVSEVMKYLKDKKFI